jgi:mRNA interferase MazF
MNIRQYEIYIVNLDPTIGSEMKKTRPCLVISPDEMNRHLRTVVIAPITSKSRPYPTRVKIDLEGEDNWVVLDQVLTLDRQRLIRRVATITGEEIKRVKDKLRETYVD